MIKVISLLVFMTAAAIAEPIVSEQIRVVDGDTIKVGGTQYRMVGYDTPEIKSARRAVSNDEIAVGRLASKRFQELINSGSLDLQEVECSCAKKQLDSGTCNFGRKCAILSLNGKNVGDLLIAEGLALPYQCSATRCPKSEWPSVIKKWNGDRE